MGYWVSWSSYYLRFFRNEFLRRHVDTHIFILRCYNKLKAQSLYCRHLWHTVPTFPCKYLALWENSQGFSATQNIQFIPSEKQTTSDCLAGAHIYMIIRQFHQEKKVGDVMVPYANQRGLDGGFSGRHYMAMSHHPLTTKFIPPQILCMLSQLAKYVETSGDNTSTRQ